MYESAEPPVYPRWRGEHQLAAELVVGWSGLSPLARGTRFVPGRSPRLIRFIPAGAGNTDLRNPTVPMHTVYPRWRGEHFSQPGILRSNYGLSPLARGTPKHSPHADRVRRFIPAGAGNTQTETEAATHGVGLSPLARGTHDAAQYGGYAWRFIPAGAGNTPAGSNLLVSMPVYPRWRGEHSMHCPRRAIHCGLSPLARGTQYALSAPGHTLRFIPAGAGNTIQGRDSGVFGPVYPRWRGEHCIYSPSSGSQIGLSPLARGTQ